MSLATGTKLGPYEIIGPLGAGGMGEVYRAKDCKLKREVALKVLPENFASDAQRMARFEREAQLLASLNHPNIAHIYGVVEPASAEAADASRAGAGALVMELVEGETLGERIRKGPIALEEAVVLAKQIAEGLEYAHDRGIVHRDLKPANIKVTPEGQVKILDFGLAKALDANDSGPDISTSPTISVMATNAGVLLGTAGYMSPEQAKGKAVDRRADIWAFGCVLYEMLAGAAAFDGETITDRLAAVVRAEPELEKLPEKTPRSIREMLRRCLIKDPKQRLQAIGEARITLEKYLANPEEASQLEADANKLGGRNKWEWMLAALGAAGTLAAVILGTLYWSRAPEKPPVVRSYIKTMSNSSFLFPSGFAVSPDGLRVAYVASSPEGRPLLWVRPLDSLQAQSLAGTEGAVFPFWSPDSRFIGFFAGGKLKKIEASGGPPLAICDAPLPRGGTWNREGVILFTPTVNTPLHKVSASGGQTAAVTTLNPANGETTHRWPYFLPDGRHFLYLAGTPFTPRETSTNAIMLGSLDSKESKFLLHSHASAVYASGNIIFLRQNTLMAQPFDLRRLELTGDASPIGDPVVEDGSNLNGAFSASENGKLTYLGGLSGASRQLVWVDRNGKRIGAAGGLDAYVFPAISPDAKKIAYTLQSSGWDIWIYDIARGLKTRLTFGSSASQANLSEVWSPDGRWIAYTCNRAGKFGLCRKPSDGSGREEILLEGGDQIRYITDWSQDGKFLTYREPVNGIYATWMLPLSGERKPYPFLQSQFPQISARFSPDGKWVAYCSNEAGDFKVYVVPFPGPGGKWQVSTGSGCNPRWRQDGKELYYVSFDNKLVAADVKASGSSFEVSSLHTLFETPPNSSAPGNFDAAADGQRFFFANEEGQPSAAITLVVNWDAELKKK